MESASSPDSHTYTQPAVRESATPTQLPSQPYNMAQRRIPLNSQQSAVTITSSVSISSDSDMVGDSEDGEELHTMNSLRTQPNGHMPHEENTPYTPHQVDKMRRSLKYHFMTPCEKYKAKKRKPWKLVVQILKIILVTLQVCSLAAQRSEFVDYERKTKIALKHIIFNNWDAGYETPPYPAAIGAYALYKTENVVEHLNYAMQQYNKTPEIAIGAFGFPPEEFQQGNTTSRSAILEITSYKVGKVYPNNYTYLLDPRLKTDTITFAAIKQANGSEVYDIKKTLAAQNTSLRINKLHKMVLNFGLTAIHIKDQQSSGPFDSPDCLRLHGKIVYDNTNHDGQLLVDLLLDLDSVDCQEQSHYEKDSTVEIVLIMAFDVLVILICIASFITCARSFYRSIRLLKKTINFFKAHFSYGLTHSERLHFINGWFIMIIISDVLVIIGTGLKVAVTYKKLTYYDATSLLLGISNVMVWLGVLRYLQFFQKYNVLVLTLKKAIPEVLRFLVCALVFYLAFTFCGWLVLGPYHFKFSSVSTASECLFALVNGDDMFVTFSMITTEKAPQSIWYFSRIYLYTFISLFIYFILNVFVSVIIGSYETIKSYYNEGFPKTVVEKFMDENDDEPTSPLYSMDTHREETQSRCSLFTCCLNQPDDSDSDTARMVST